MHEPTIRSPRRRREILLAVGSSLAAITVTVLAPGMAQAQAQPAPKKPKRKASKEDFFYQETPGENGKRCETCVNFEPTAGDKGTCSLLEGEVCKNCFCQGWTDKKSAKKPST